jgi:hypothetical protein
MAISHNLSKIEEELIQTIRAHQDFVSINVASSEKGEKWNKFRKDILAEYKKFNYEERYDLIEISKFVADVDYRYFMEETENIGAKKFRKIPKNEFQKFFDNCKNDQYVYFRFTDSAIHFNLGYLSKNCTNNCEFFPSNIDIKEDRDIYQDQKNKTGNLHKKEDFNEFNNF